MSAQWLVLNVEVYGMIIGCLDIFLTPLFVVRKFVHESVNYLIILDKLNPMAKTITETDKIWLFCADDISNVLFELFF